MNFGLLNIGSFTALTFCFLINFISISNAQDIPPSTRPDVIGQELRSPVVPLANQDFTLPTPSVGGIPDGVEDVRFLLNEVLIEGNNALSQVELQSLYGELIGHEVALSRVFEAASDITAYYAQAGYALVVAYVPAQKIADGIVRISVVEGFVSEVQMAGDQAGQAPTGIIAQRANNIKTERPLTAARLERELLLLNDTPGITVGSVLGRGDGAVGGTRLILDIEEKPFDFSLGFNTRGSKALGPTRVQGAVAFNNLFGTGTQISANGMATTGDDSLKHYGAQFLSHGLSGHISWTDSKPSIANLKLLEFASNGLSGGIGYAHNFVRTRNRNISARVSFDFQNATSDFLSVANSEDKTRVLSLSLDYDRVEDSGAFTKLSTSLAHGVGLFGATKNDDPLKSLFYADFGFWKANASAVRLQPLFGDIQLMLQAAGQVAFDPTPIAQHCGYGGAAFGRGFDSFEISGDHCATFSAELRKNIFPSSEGTVDYFQIFGFFDTGKVWTKGMVIDGAEASASATSVGAGARLSLFEHVDISVEYAKPMGRDVGLEGNRKGRVFISVSARF